MVECLRLSCIHARSVAASGCLVAASWCSFTGMATARAGSMATTAAPIARRALARALLCLRQLASASALDWTYTFVCGKF
jgi:hypothetical protein